MHHCAYQCMCKWRTTNHHHHHHLCANVCCLWACIPVEFCLVHCQARARSVYKSQRRAVCGVLSATTLAWRALHGKTSKRISCRVDFVLWSRLLRLAWVLTSPIFAELFISTCPRTSSPTYKRLEEQVVTDSRLSAIFFSTVRSVNGFHHFLLYLVNVLFYV